MKYLLSIITITLAMSLSAQDMSSAFAVIEQKDVSALGTMLDEETDLCILDDQDILAKSEVVSKLKKFLEAHPPKSCEEVHSGKSKNKKSNYRLGKLTTTSGAQYRVFLFIEKNKILELRIDKW